MPKRELNAKDVLNDIESGLSDIAMRRKYKLTPKGLQSLLTKVIAAGLLTTHEVDETDTEADEGVTVMWACPACGTLKPEEFDRCPNCDHVLSRSTEDD
ncbi:hypothetical protein ACFL2Q_19720 [Thermodesulfobacteriota bacterium]